jgi:plasmid stabilization system protein ParE
LNIRFLSPARHEFEDAVRAYNSQRVGLGDDFRDATRETLERIKAFPDAWHVLGDNVRRCWMRRFPYAVIYAHDTAEILVLAIAHVRREPTYWNARKR